jgi:uncharacterized protein DUF2550
MTEDDIAGIVIAAGAMLVAGLFAFYWRQRLGFTRGSDPVVSCSLRWWKGPVGLGWRQGFAKLGRDQVSWRRRLTFRSTAAIVLDRSAVKLVDRQRPSWQSWLWISSCDVLILETSGRQLELGLLPDDADLLLDWLGTSAERPPAKINQMVSIAMWAFWLVSIVLFWGWRTGNAWVVPGILLGLALIALVGGFVWGVVRRRRLLSEAIRDDFVASANEVFAFLHDFGFDDAFVQHFPWETTLVFTGDGERVVVVTNDRRARALSVSIGHRSDEQLARLRAILEAAGHPDPDRVTRYDGADGPLRAALDANAHALRLWGRSFLIERAAQAPKH